MANSPASRFLKVGSDDAALALPEAFDSVVRADWENMTYLSNFEVDGIVQRRDVGPGQKFEFKEVGELDDAVNYTEGTEMTGQNYAFDEGEVTLDPFLVKHNFLPMGQMDDWQWEAMMPLAREQAEAHARVVDKRGFVTLALAAREAAKTKAGISGDTLTIHPGGNRVNRVGASGIESAYPATKTGAFQLRDDIEQILQNAAENDAPYGGVTAFMSPYLKRVMAKDDRKFDRDFGSTPNSYVGYEIVEDAGVKFVFTNNMPSTNITGTSLGGTASDPLASKYQGDFRYTATNGQPAVLFAWSAGNRSPIGYVTRGGVQTGTEFQQTKLGSLLMSYQRCGWGIIHPPCAGEIYVTDS